MARLLDKLIVMDLESTCWEGIPPPGQQSEIIEIGICTLDLKTREIEDNQGLLIKPRQSEISPFCTQLTSINAEMIDQSGIAFEEALRVLKKQYRSDQRAWASWGDYDRKQMQSNCRLYNQKYPFGPTHLNAKTLFSILKGHSREMGMAQALDAMGLPLEGRHHRGIDDARNIAVILQRILFG